LKRYSIILKIVAFVLIAASAVTMMLTILEIKKYTENDNISELYIFDNLSANRYTDTHPYENYYYHLQMDLETIIEYKSEQYILDGKTVSQQTIDERKNYMFNEKSAYIQEQFYDPKSGMYLCDEETLYNKFLEDYKEEIDNIKNDLMQEHLSYYKYSIQKIQNDTHIKYYINTGENIITNSDFQIISDSEYAYTKTNQSSDGKTIISQGAFSIDKNYINDMNNNFLTAKNKVSLYLMSCFACVVLFLAGLSYLVFAAGRKFANPNEIKLIFIDKLYNEIIVLLLIFSVFSTGACGSVIFRNDFNITFMFMLYVSSVLLAVALILILIRHIKNKTILKHTFIFIFFYSVFKQIKKVFDAGSVMIKAILLVVVLGLLTAIPFVFIATLPLALVFTYLQIKKFIAVKTGLERIKSGDYQQNIEISGNGEIAILAADINDISAGLGVEVERRLKSERLKTELIINVSHDIRTPLTSVITYTDLLKNENIDNENAVKYIDIISKKSNRLKTLVDDLFDASKAASGNIPVKLAEVDINALITQGFGELDEQIKNSTLDFKINMQDDKILAYADGKLTWRVFENLLSNVFKYSLENSRVYIEVFNDNNNVYIEIKNISSTELNIPEDEIMERFKRGDEARSSEGSGLGLDIAKSLMLCQNGELIIKIDGDLFKVKLKLPIYENKNMEANL